MKLEEKIAEAIEAWQNDPDANPYFVEDGEQSLAEAIAQSLSSLCVGVKDLEWEELPDRDGSVFEARHPFGSYVVQDMRGERPHVIVYSGHRGAWGEESPSGTQFPTLEAAQQACQSDFASRWAACGNIRTEEEVVEGLIDAIERKHDEIASDSGCCPTKIGSPWKTAAQCLRNFQQEGKGDA